MLPDEDRQVGRGLNGEYISVYVIHITCLSGRNKMAYSAEQVLVCLCHVK